MEEGENPVSRGRGEGKRHIVRARVNMEVRVDLTQPWPLVKGSRSLVISIHQCLRREL